MKLPPNNEPRHTKRAEQPQVSEPRHQDASAARKRFSSVLDHVSYHVPFFLPSHHTNPTVAVFCSFFKLPGCSVRKNGWLDQSRRYSTRPGNPSANFSILSISNDSRSLGLGVAVGTCAAPRTFTKSTIKSAGRIVFVPQRFFVVFGSCLGEQPRGSGVDRLTA